MNLKLSDQINFYYEFKDWYSQILEDFKFDFIKECESRDYLSQIFLKKSQKWNLETVLSQFKETISLKPMILIYGCGPSLEKTFNIILKRKGLNFFKNFINLTADGASTLLRKKRVQIDAIFTDLDGITKNEFKYARFNVVHAHGDNREKLNLFKNEIIKFENIIGTTQIEPTPNVLNPGGFTDGDRILYFLRTLLQPFHKLFLIGMDFGTIIGKYSKLDLIHNQKASPIKLKKLQYAIKLIRWISDKIDNKICLVNSECKTRDFPNLSIETFLKFFNI